MWEDREHGEDGEHGEHKENTALSAQFCREPKTVLKNNAYFFLKEKGLKAPFAGRGCVPSLLFLGSPGTREPEANMNLLFPSVWRVPSYLHV